MLAPFFTKELQANHSVKNTRNEYFKNYFKQRSSFTAELLAFSTREK